MVLSTGIRCPKHGWCFDLFTGSADHGPYQMQLWDVELRDIADSDAKEVWIRRKPCHK
jgi:nitrite reductase/ring-hydroxylating ferredoxin subunit